MSNERLLRKTAVDKNKKKLGPIVRIEDLLGKTIKKAVPHAMVLVKKIFKGEIHVPIEIKKVIEVTDQLVSFNILKTDFDKEAEKLRIIKKQREFEESKSPYEYRTRARLSPYTRNLPRSRNRRK